MAAYQTSHAAPMGATAIYRSVAVVAEGVMKLRQWNDRRVTRNALSKLSDRELSDIGLCRGDVEWIGR